jgi:hypothetical protein
MASRPGVPRSTFDTLKPESLRGAPGFYRVGQDGAGRWWLVQPDGKLVIGCGVDGVRLVPGGLDDTAAVEQLRDWSFNVIGPGSAPALRDGGLPFVEALELRRAGDFLFRLGGARLPDVFDPRWAAACEERLAGVTSRRDRVGFVTDSDLGWAQAGGAETRPTLLQICLSLDPRFRAYHAAWEFALAPYAGDFTQLARAWNLEGPNKEALRQWTIEDRRIDAPAYREAHARFSGEFVQRYLRTAGEIVRRHAPGTLLFGPPLPVGLAAGSEVWVDVRVVPESAPVGSGPVWVAHFSWVPGARQAGAGGRLSALERMHREGRAALEALLRQPTTVGYFWSEYMAGERATEAPFGRGLLYEDGLPAMEHVQPLAAINRAARSLHGRA